MKRSSLTVPARLLVAGALVMTMTACGGSSSSDGGSDDSAKALPTLKSGCQRPDKETSITLGMGHSLSFTPLVYLAEAKGYFKDENLKVSYKTIANPSDVLALLNSGDIDAAYGGVTAGFINAAARGLKVRAVASQGVYPDSDKQPAAFYVRTDLMQSGKVKEVKDLKGMTFGLQGGTGDIGNAGGYFLAKLLKYGGLTLDDVKIRNVGVMDTDKAFKNKSIDAAFLPSPFSTIVETDKSGTKFGPNSLLAAETQGGLMFGTTLNQDDPVAGAALVRALDRAAAELKPGYSKDPAVLKALSDHGIEQKVVAATPEYLFRDGLSWNKDTFESIQDIFHDYGHGVLTSKESIPFEKLTNEPLRKAAVASLSSCGY